MDFKITKGHYKLRCVSINIYIYIIIRKINMMVESKINSLLRILEKRLLKAYFCIVQE